MSCDKFDTYGRKKLERIQISSYSLVIGTIATLGARYTFCVSDQSLHIDP